jgi:hypothetical protein
MTSLNDLIQRESVEEQFLQLVAEGWPEPRPRQVSQANGGLALILMTHEIRMAAQLANSIVTETREFWRNHLAFLRAYHAQKEMGE